MPVRLSESQVTIYRADTVGILPQILSRQSIADLSASVGLAWQLFIRNLRSQYRQTLLGYFWILMPPLATTVIWWFLHSIRVVQFNTPGIPYPLYLLVGMLLWQGFVDALQAPLRVVSDSKQLLAKVNFPRESLVLAGLGEVAFTFGVRMVFLAIIFIGLGYVPAITLPLAFLSVAALFVLGTVIGLILTPMGLLYQDVGRGLGIFAQFWLYLTPVIYPPPESFPASLLNWLNPVSPLLIVARDWMLTGTTGSLTSFIVVSACLIPAMLAGWIYYRITLPLVIERLSA
jgi:lipopolysaccharide transport system permease protein